jgi:hypothetical protein
VPNRKITFAIKDKKLFKEQELREALSNEAGWDEMELLSGP